MKTKDKLNRISTYRDFVGELQVTYKRTEMPTKKITSSKDASEFMRPYFDEVMDDHEEVKILHLSRSNHIVNVHHASVGDVNGCLIPIKLILQQALVIKCSGILAFHNHPSGTLKPSAMDIQVTKKLRDACKLLELPLLDHIILTREGYYSMADNHDM